MSSLADLPVPSDEKIVSLCTLLRESILREQLTHRFATTKNILTFIGGASVIGLSFFVPSALIVAKPFLDAQKEKERNQWKHFNSWYLRRSIVRLQKEKYVEVQHKDDEDVIVLTEQGKRKVLTYAVNRLSIAKPRHWDGKWRVLIYDVIDNKRYLRDVFRSSLRKFGFLKLQESVWIYPYSCEQQIAFLREYCGVGNDVIYLVASTLENDQPYREYFDLSPK